MAVALFRLKSDRVTGQQLARPCQIALNVVRVGDGDNRGQQELVLRISQQLAKGSVNF
jgi:hypothetical protein